MAMKSELRTPYEYHNLTVKFALMSRTENERKPSPEKSTTAPASSGKREPFLPRIRVEECGLTVEARDRETWKQRGRSTKSWKPGKKRREGKRRSIDDISLIKASLSASRNGFYTLEHRDREGDLSAHDARSSVGKCATETRSEATSEFVGSLKVGVLPLKESKSKEISAGGQSGRELRWPVGRLAYATSHPPEAPHPANTELPTLPADSSSKKRLAPLQRSSTFISDAPGTVSPRERVILNKLASKHKHDKKQAPRNQSKTGGGEKFLYERKGSPVDIDQYLPATHLVCDPSQSTPPTTQAFKPFRRGEELYDVIDNATRRLLRQHELDFSTSASVSSETSSSGSLAMTSGYDSLDERLIEKAGVSEPARPFTYPLFGDFKPSEVGHFCPPNSPDFEKG